MLLLKKHIGSTTTKNRSRPGMDAGTTTAPRALGAAAAPPPPPPSAAPKPLVVVGSVNADLVLAVDRVPAPGETLPARSLDTFPGGKGANQAAAAARLGYPTYFIGATGTDSNAALLRAALADCGVRLDHLRQTEGPSGTAVILLQPSGVVVDGALAGRCMWRLVSLE
jgi:ribokinase